MRIDKGGDAPRSKGSWTDERQRERNTRINTEMCARMGSEIKKTASNPRRNKLNGDEWAEGEWVEVEQKKGEKMRVKKREDRVMHNSTMLQTTHDEDDIDDMGSERITKTHINLLT